MVLDKKISLLTLVGLILLEGLSLLSHLDPTIGPAAFVGVVGLIGLITARKLEYGVLAILAELAIGSQGRLLVFDDVSLRMALFVVVLAFWLGRQIKNRQPTLFTSPLYPYLFLFLFIAGGLVQGLLNNNLGDVFFDFNAWLFFALLFVFVDVSRTKDFFQRVMSVMVTATGWLALKTIVTLVLFSHAVTAIGGTFYTWLRDSRVAEITYISGNMFRIFFQSHLYVLIGGLLVLTILLLNWKKLSPLLRVGAVIYIYLTSLTIIISQSRSFWLGGLTAVAGLLIVARWQFKINYKTIVATAVLLVIMIVDQIYAVQFLTGSFGQNVVGERFQGLSSQAAGLSRINQLDPLGFAIGQQLLVGYGFGKTLTYVSSDPRIVASHPNGVYTTYAFEWGYLDIMLKLGALGLLIYLFIIFQLYKIGLQKNPVTVGLLIALTGLLITNIFSPYLNHPLGIGYILLLTGLLLQPGTDKTFRPA